MIFYQLFRKMENFFAGFRKVLRKDCFLYLRKCSVLEKKVYLRKNLKYQSYFAVFKNPKVLNSLKKCGKIHESGIQSHNLWATLRWYHPTYVIYKPFAILQTQCARHRQNQGKEKTPRAALKFFLSIFFDWKVILSQTFLFENFFSNNPSTAW